QTLLVEAIKIARRRQREWAEDVELLRRVAAAMLIEQDQAISHAAVADEEICRRRGLEKTSEHLVRRHHEVALRVGISPRIERNDLAEGLEKARVVQTRQREFFAIEGEAAERTEIGADVHPPLDVARLLAK